MFVPSGVALVSAEVMRVVVQVTLLWAAATAASAPANAAAFTCMVS
jgi:hypothetical protein